MEFISSAVPDSFNQQGQVWGNALYKWDNINLATLNTGKKS